MNFIGTWLTRDGSKVQVSQSVGQKFSGKVIEPYVSPPDYTWDAKGDCEECPELDLMERISERTKK